MGTILTVSPNKSRIGDMVQFSNYKFPPDLSKMYDTDLVNQLSNTHAAISALNQMKNILQNTDLLMRPILTKEAESSSQLEGTQASIDDVYQIDITEQTEEKRNDALEIRNYEDAMFTAIDILKKTKKDISELLIRETHKTLMRGVRGQSKNPGEYRKDAVWIGKSGTTKDEAKYMPPDFTQVPALMESFVKFSQKSGGLHPLIVSAILHHRFEAIHPFKDGNGRVGRLLISIYLINKGILDLPMLYPSGYFDKNKDEYLESLHNVDKNQNWYSWIMFFLRALEHQSKISHTTALKIDSLFKHSRSLIENERAGINLIRTVEFVFKRLYMTSSILERELNIPRTTCDRYLDKLVARKIVEYVGVHNRNKVYANRKMLKILTSV